MSRNGCCKMEFSFGHTQRALHTLAVPESCLAESWQKKNFRLAAPQHFSKAPTTPSSCLIGSVCRGPASPSPTKARRQNATYVVNQKLDHNPLFRPSIQKGHFLAGLPPPNGLPCSAANELQKYCTVALQRQMLWCSELPGLGTTRKLCH